MNNTNDNLIDFSQLINILRTGIWIILTFFITGLLIGYIYQNNYEYSDGEVQYRMSIPFYELGTVDKLKLNELNYSIKKLYAVEYEKTLLTQREISPTIDLFSQSVVINENIELLS